MSIALDANVKTLTEEQLDELYTQLLARQDDVHNERQRRTALPFIWDSEKETVKALRQILGKPESAGSPEEPIEFVKPTSAMDAYIMDDHVLQNGKHFMAVGRGAIYVEPGVNDPIQGLVWMEFTEEENLEEPPVEE